MTIKEFAKKQSISTQAVYQKLKAAGISLNSIKQGNSQELTQEGIKQLENIFFKKNKEESNSIESLKLENKFLKEQLEQLKKQLEQLQSDCNKLQDLLQREQQATHQAQAIQMATIQALSKKPSLWARLTGKTKDEKQPSSLEK